MDIKTLTKEQQRDLYEVVLLFAQRCRGARDVAEDLTHEAFVLQATTRPWDESRPTSLERHLCGIVRSLAWARRISKKPAIEHQAAMEHIALAQSGRSAEIVSLGHAERVTDETRATTLVEKLLVKLAGREPETTICGFMADGVTKPSQLALLTSRTAAEISEALKRIRRYMKSILAAERGEDEEVT